MSDGLTNEPLVIASIRASMQRIFVLSRQVNENLAAQGVAYNRDVHSPSAPGEFTTLTESNTVLQDEYAVIKREILGQVSAHSEFCDRYKIEPSDDWNKLMDELYYYLVDIKVPYMMNKGSSN